MSLAIRARSRYARVNAAFMQDCTITRALIEVIGSNAVQRRLFKLQHRFRPTQTQKNSRGATVKDEPIEADEYSHGFPFKLREPYIGLTQASATERLMPEMVGRQSRPVLGGGGGGIRTHGGLSPTSVFKTGAFNRSATPPL